MKEQICLKQKLINLSSFFNTLFAFYDEQMFNKLNDEIKNVLPSWSLPLSQDCKRVLINNFNNFIHNKEFQYLFDIKFDNQKININNLFFIKNKLFWNNLINLEINILPKLLIKLLKLFKDNDLNIQVVMQQNITQEEFFNKLKNIKKELKIKYLKNINQINNILNDLTLLLYTVDDQTKWQIQNELNNFDIQKLLDQKVNDIKLAQIGLHKQGKKLSDYYILINTSNLKLIKTINYQFLPNTSDNLLAYNYQYFNSVIKNDNMFKKTENKILSMMDKLFFKDQQFTNKINKKITNYQSVIHYVFNYNLNILLNEFIHNHDNKIEISINNLLKTM